MGVHITLGAQVSGALLEGRKPTIDGRMLTAQAVALVISE